MLRICYGVRLEPETPLTWDILFVYEDGALGCTASPRRRISSTCLTLPSRSSLQPIGDVRYLLGSCLRHKPRRKRGQLNLHRLGARCRYSNLARYQRTAIHCAGDAALTSLLAGLATAVNRRSVDSPPLRGPTHRRGHLASSRSSRYSRALTYDGLLTSILYIRSPSP